MFVKVCLDVSCVNCAFGRSPHKRRQRPLLPGHILCQTLTDNFRLGARLPRGNVLNRKYELFIKIDRGFLHSPTTSAIEFTTIPRTPYTKYNSSAMRRP